jgi:hypothetical protein
LEGIGKLEVTIEHKRKTESIQVDDDWLNKERKRIEDEYTYLIKNFGRVILYTDKDAFDEAAWRFKSIVEKYQDALRRTLVSKQSEFEKRILDEFSPRWKQNPPSIFARWRIEPTSENILLAFELQPLLRAQF